MTVAYSTTLRNARLDAVTSAVGNAGKLRIYDGSRPASGGAATNLLAEFTLGSPFAGAASSGGPLSVTLPSNVNASASGTATWFRVVTSGGTFVIDGSVSTSGSDLNLVTTSITSGQPVSITSWTITTGNA